MVSDEVIKRTLILLAASALLAACRATVSAVPTAAPTATPGPAPTENVEPLPTLAAGPLLTPEQVLGQLLVMERDQAVIWEHPWSLDTLKTDPARIRLQWFPSRTAESGRPGAYGPGLDAEAGPVWWVSIRGHVHIEMLTLGSLEDMHKAVYDGLTYVIAQDSGALLSEDTGSPVPGAAPLTR